MFGAVKLTKNADKDKYKYSSYSKGFDLHSEFSLPNRAIGKNVTIFVADISSSMHTDNKRKDILTPGKHQTQGLDGTTFTAEAKYPINFTQSNRNFV